MEINQLINEFKQIAVRYKAKDYLTAEYRNYLFDGVGSIYDGENTFDYYFIRNMQLTKDIMFPEHVTDYEIKAFLFHMKEFAREKGLTRFSFSLIHNNMQINTYKEVEVRLDELPW